MSPENARHPEHKTDLGIDSEKEMVDHACSEGSKSTKDTDLPEEEVLKVSAWIYPSVHQEIYSGRPTDFLGGCGNRLAESPQHIKWSNKQCHSEKDAAEQFGEGDESETKQDSAWLCREKYQEINDWRPTEWLVGCGRMANDAPCVCSQKRIGSCPVWTGNIASPNHGDFNRETHRTHPEPIHIEGLVVQNSPFRSPLVVAVESEHKHPEPIKLNCHPVKDSPFLHG